MSDVRQRIASFFGRHPESVTRVPLSFALLGAAALVLVKAWIYIGNPAPPFAYYYDLGVNAIATSYMVHAFASWKDFSDNLGWAGYGDVPNFYFNPELSYFILVPLAKLFHDVWFTIKTVQTLQEVVAFYGAALFYATFYRSRVWSALAGLLYATLPATALQVRGNIDIGWAIALAPLALAVSLRLARRFGETALPLCGVLLSLGGFCFAVEYLFFTTLPAYVFTIAYVLLSRSRSRASASTLGFALLGFVCIFGLGGYFILPTLGGRQFFTDPAARTAVLQNGTLLDLFSESWYGLLALMPREFLISAYSQFNAVTRLGAIVPATALLWILAIGTAVSAVKRKLSSNLAGAAVAIACALLALSLGSSIPLGDGLWALLRSVPGFALVRTPDRFLALPLVLIVAAAVAALQKLSSAGFASRALSLAVPALAIASFLNFDFAEHWLTNENNVNSSEPALTEVNERVAAAGGRTLSYSVVRGGSEFYTPSYGVPTPTIWYFWDIASHYRDDGLQGYGIFRRANVHTVIATPDWSDDVSLPTSDELDNDFPGTTLVASGDGVIVKRIGARPPLNEMTSTCVYGGPGLLDSAAALPALNTAAYVSSAAACSHAVFLNYEPGPDGFASRIATWDAGALLRPLPALIDADYSFNIGRTFINDPWYRNSIDGDEALSDGGARIISTPVAVSLPLRTAPLRGDETLEIHLASRRHARIVIGGEGGRTATIDVSPRPGIHWYPIPLRSFGGVKNLTLTIDVCAGALCDRRPWDGVAFDGAAIVRGAAKASSDRAVTGAALFSIPALVAESAPLAGVANVGATTLSLSSTDGIFHRPLSEEPFVAVGGNGTLRYRWTGPSGGYVISASAKLHGAGATIAIEAGTGPRHCCRVTSAYDSSAQTQEVLDLATQSHHSNEEPSPVPGSDTQRERAKHVVGLLLRTHLTRGALITVTLSYPLTNGGNRSGAAGGAALSALTVSPVLSQAPETSHSAGRQTFVMSAEQLARALSSQRAVDFEVNRASGMGGAFIEHRFSVPVDARSATLRVTSEGSGEGTARLECDGYVAARAIVAPITYVAVSGARLRHCRSRIAWLRGPLSLTALELDMLGDRTRDARARIWIPNGTYSLQVMQTGARLRTATILLDGRPAGRTAVFERASYHSVVVKGVTVRDRVLAFIATGTSLSRSIRLDTQQRSTFDWRVRVTVPGTLEIASYPDGEWRLNSIGGDTAGASSGIRCDLIETCFSNVRPGLYRLHHVWPASLRIGMWFTCLAIIVAILPFVYARIALRDRRHPSAAIIEQG